MFGRKKEIRNVRATNSRSSLSQYGLVDIPVFDNSALNINSGDGCDDDNDEDLEAELLALTSHPEFKNESNVSTHSVDLDYMASESLQDVSSDDNVSVDENDPALLNELNDLVEDDCNNLKTREDKYLNQRQSLSAKKMPDQNVVTLLRDRVKMYEEAEINARRCGETMRVRRLTRGIKTLNKMIQEASAGRTIEENDIPPPVLVSSKTNTGENKASDSPEGETSLLPGLLPATSSDEHPNEDNENITFPVDPKQSPNAVMKSDASSEMLIVNPSDSVDRNILEILLAKRNEFKEAALAAKRCGNQEKALRYVRIVKQFEPVIAAATEGRPVDLDTIPPPPEEYELLISKPLNKLVREDSEKQKSDNTFNMIGEAAEMMAAAASAQDDVSDAASTSVSIPQDPLTVLEALEQRLAKYISAEKAARDEGNSSKIRRMGRIVKQYQSAIKAHKAGKPFCVDELPTPPGFGPIPVKSEEQPKTDLSDDVERTTKPSEDASLPDIGSPVAVNSGLAPGNASSNEYGVPSASAGKTNVNKSRLEKQLSLVLSRQKKFREAAIEAKRKGEINQAKEYLRIAKGFDPLIEACQSGLPIDLSSVPVAPENKKDLENDFDIVTLDDCFPGPDSDIYEKLEEDLLKQTKMCLTTRDHFKATGDIASANRFEQLAVHSKKDLDAVKCAHKRNDPIPKFHYETRTFSIVQCCTELGDNDLELSVIQGINYNVPNPKDIDTYVKFEFPYPTEAPAKDRTGVIKNSNNPQYNQTFLLSIQRNVRACQRVFKRHGIKLEVWSRGGFFRGDSLIGTASVKLIPLETKCVLHDAFDLMDGRKAVGGKLEVKVRVRHPIVTKQLDKVQEKWLVIDQYL